MEERKNEERKKKEERKEKGEGKKNERKIFTSKFACAYQFKYKDIPDPEMDSNEFFLGLERKFRKYLPRVNTEGFIAVITLDKDCTQYFPNPNF